MIHDVQIQNYSPVELAKKGVDLEQFATEAISTFSGPEFNAEQHIKNHI